MPSAISPSSPSFSTVGTPKAEHPRAALGWPPYALQEGGFFPASSREGKSLQVLWKGLAWVTCPPLSHSYSQGEVTCGRHCCSSILTTPSPPSSGNSIRLPLETHSFLISQVSVGAGISTPHLLAPEMSTWAKTGQSMKNHLPGHSDWRLKSNGTRWSFYNILSIEWGQRRQWHPTPVLLPGKSHGQRSLVGCNPWGREESDMTERLHFHFLLSGIGEGNVNPLQCSCLENPRDGGVWWAAIYGVTQSRTRLKWLSR